MCEREKESDVSQSGYKMKCQKERVQKKVQLDKKRRNVRNGVEVHWVGMLGGG